MSGARVCAHADDGRPAHVLQPGERCEPVAAGADRPMSDAYDEIARTEMEAERDATYGPRPVSDERDRLSAELLKTEIERAELLAERDRGHDLNVKLLARMDRLAAQVAAVRALADRWGRLDDEYAAAAAASVRAALDAES